MAERSLSELDLAALTAGRTYFSSPSHWEDEVIYFLMVDRFSDNRENFYRDADRNLVTSGSTPPFTPADAGNAILTDADAAAWRDAGTRFCGGNLAGVESKLGYLKRLGVTVLWLSPIFQQVNADTTYHGYGIQNFLDVDAHFGTREDLRRLVASAHALGIRVILDVILNHSGDVFHYVANDPSWNGSQFPVLAFRDAAGNPIVPFGAVTDPAAFPGSAIWPSEFQSADVFTREGHINNFDYFPEYAVAISSTKIRRSTRSWPRSMSCARTGCRCGAAGNSCVRSPATV